MTLIVEIKLSACICTAMLSVSFLDFYLKTDSISVLFHTGLYSDYHNSASIFGYFETGKKLNFISSTFLIIEC